MQVFRWTYYYFIIYVSYDGLYISFLTFKLSGRRQFIISDLWNSKMVLIPVFSKSEF